MTKTSLEDNNQSIRCRPRPRYLFWLLAVLFLIITGCDLFLPNTGPHPVPTKTFAVLRPALALLFGGLALGTIAWMYRAEVIADQIGLRWRGLGRWRRAAWSDVTDYGDRLHRVGQRSEVRTEIRTRQGTVTLDQCWSRRDVLRRAVQQRATNTRVQGWALFGSRPEADWKCTFDYNTLDNRLSLFLMPILMGAGLFLLCRAVGRVPEMAAEMGWPLAVASALMFCALLLLPGGVYAATFLLYRETWRRRWHRIVASPSGLLFEADGRRVEAAWEDVTDFYSEGYSGWRAWQTQFVVVTKHGAFDFLRTLKHLDLLTATIGCHASAADGARRASGESETLGGDRGQWSGGRIRVGQRVYHYQTRSNRALLWLPTAMALLCALLVLLNHAGLTRSRDLLGPTTTGAVFLVLALWGWWRFFSAKIVVDEQGFSQYTPFARRSISWTQVQDFYGDQEGWSFYIMGDGQRLGFWQGIADREELQDEILRRAVHSRSQEWKQKE